MGDMHAVMIMDGDRVVVSRFGVPTDKVTAVVEELQQGTAPGLRVFVDGRDMSDAITRAPKGESVAQPAKGRGATRPKAGEDSELQTAELAHHMLWESFKRSCQVQSYMLDKMTGCAVEMNRRFVAELETMRANYTKALEKIDGVQFEQRMLEHESASRHLSNHYARMAEEDHRAAERRRLDGQSVVEQLARGVLRVIDVVGSDSINGDKN
jgi:hypothetical protein